jgi:hypothetical protein
MKFLKKLILVATVFYIPLQSMAWGTQGHRICGQIASTYLTPKARLAIEKLLCGESLALAGNWADFVRSDPDYSYLTPWHYVDFDKLYTYSEMMNYLNHDTNVDAYTKLNFLVGELKKNNPDKKTKLFYLHMLIHLVEDVHQPLHAAHSDDKGGNDFKLNWFTTPINMHSLWDTQLIDFQQLSYTEYAAEINHTTAIQRAEWQKAPISKWIFESNQITEKLYNEVKPGDTLGYKYNFTHIATVNDRLVKAGVRLAGILNQLFG